jgi:hypothetical protein
MGQAMRYMLWLVGRFIIALTWIVMAMEQLTQLPKFQGKERDTRGL